MQDAINRLTPKQSQCLALVAEGMTSKEIARSLGLSARTVDDHVEKARIKLGAPTRQRAAAIFRAQQAVPSTPYQLRCEPPAVDESAMPEPINAPTSGLNDSGAMPFGHFPAVATSQPSSRIPEAVHHPSSTLTVTMQILAIAAAIALIALASPQLIRGAEAIADFILKTTRTDRGIHLPR